jgi:2-amino-4-hydroxy-6-hydroxymethyldihydropteridine diphosphokinase
MGRVIDPTPGEGRRTATTVAVALGSNVGDRLAHLEFAVARLKAHLAGVVVSPFIETEPVGVGPQGPFLNGALVARFSGTPRDLLDTLLRIEAGRGRVRPYAGAPRTLDLDLILFGAAVLDEPGLTVPHPRFRDRRFVLEPLAAIAPGLVDPVSGRTIAQLLGALAGSA